MKYFITYGDENYEQSKRRIAAEAIATGNFDQVVTYSRKDLDKEFLTSPLFNYRKGGGYFVWKPYIVEKTLEQMHEGDLLVYADCGCTVFRSREWKKYFGLLEKYNGVVFMLPLTCEAYTRKNVLDNYTAIGKHWKKRYQVSATFFLFKKNRQTMAFAREWKETMVRNPEFVVDVQQELLHNESPKFVENRYDQSVFSALAYKYEKEYGLKILFHHFEGYDRFLKQALVATRISDTEVRGGNKRPVLKNILYYLLAMPYRRLYQKIWVLRK
ncbi:hypothetical protein [Flavisolibacter nicotianae]|uniref:hypothetical protein n=1 Tax=Flavisolibacter nicotianae TaxID=2364882 RepID=UPI000EB4484F|nr:hypothetical protein [Flavisolibacter nicotianae]